MLGQNWLTPQSRTSNSHYFQFCFHSAKQCVLIWSREDRTFCGCSWLILPVFGEVSFHCLRKVAFYWIYPASTARSKCKFLGLLEGAKDLGGWGKTSPEQGPIILDGSSSAPPSADCIFEVLVERENKYTRPVMEKYNNGIELVFTFGICLKEEKGHKPSEICYTL